MVSPELSDKYVIVCDKLLDDGAIKKQGFIYGRKEREGWKPALFDTIFEASNIMPDAIKYFANQSDAKGTPYLVHIPQNQTIERRANGG